MRLIDADALKASFPKAQSDIFQNCRRCTCMDNEEIDTVIDSAPTVGGWISVKDRMPNSCGVYIVARWFSDGCEKRVLSDACYFDGLSEWFDDTRVNFGREFITNKVVAWMPLPPPPKEEA